MRFTQLMLVFGMLLGSQCSLYAQKSTQKTKPNTRLDSIKAANKARLDSVRTINEARRDSLQAVREKMANARSIALAEKKALFASRKKPPPLSQEMSAGYRLNSDGWSLIVHRGFIKSDDPERIHTTFLWVDLSEKRNPKERRLTNENFAAINPGDIRPLSYKYGKINNFYQLKIGYGNMKPITGRLDKKSVQISWVYAGALSLGMLKPYYLDLLIPEGNTVVRKQVKYSEDIKEYFLDLNNQGTIIGGSTFIQGISEIKMKPGLAARSGFYFDYAPTRKSFIGVEIGASAELYTQEIPIMINAKNTPYFFNFYADIRFGRRWE